MLKAAWLVPLPVGRVRGGREAWTQTSPHPTPFQRERAKGPHHRLIGKLCFFDDRVRESRSEQLNTFRSFLFAMTLLKPVCSAMEIVGRFTRCLWFYRPEFTFVTVRIICSKG